VRRLVIRFVLPLAFTSLPVLAGVAVAAAIPADAMRHYLHRIESSPIDWLILGLGGALFGVQTLLAFAALRWRGMAFDERPDRWLGYLAQSAEWFPLLGLLGTVAAILQTFSAMTPQATPRDIIQNYAPAITATGSGLFMALLNILPSWVVNAGRDLILTLAGPPAAPSGDRP
jgi:hypothetical protein